MMKDYIYEVARIRVTEGSLLKKADLDQLLAEPDYDSAVTYLKEKGWGAEGTESESAEQMLKAESEASWALIDELLKGSHELDILRIGKDYHNLKAIIKQLYQNADLPFDRLLEEGGTLDKDAMRLIIEERAYDKLPEDMREAAREASEVLSRTGDGQLCDIIIDKAALSALTDEAKKVAEPVLKEYAAVTAVSADIRMALRAAAAGKDAPSIKNMLAEAPELDLSALTEAALKGKKDVARYLKNTPYAELSDALERSMSAFECACDNLMIKRIKPQLSESLRLGPLAAYVIARENELKSVRLLLSGKKNGLPQELLAENVRETYV